jgi:glycosyltransferase involved in cell wall biosynthesis
MSINLDKLFKVVPNYPVIAEPPRKNFKKPIVTILIPTLNEEITILRFIDWVHQGLQNASISGEILIVDSSTDQTPYLAWESGVRVLRLPKKGLGNAYKSAIPYIRGEYVILGDADCTYDFREIESFLKELQNGSDFVMGNRFRGIIEKKSMPKLHQYFGTPATSWLLRTLHSLPFGDIHCGMRALSYDLYKSLPFDEPGWEYAPEMVIRAGQRAHRISEVPINFYKEPEGRLSHFRRGKFAWISPIRAGLGSIRVTLIHALDKILIKLGWLAFVFGTFGVATVSVTTFRIQEITFGMGSVAAFSIFGIFGYFCLFIGFMLKRLFAENQSSGNKLGKLINFEIITIFLLIWSVILFSLILYTLQNCATSTESCLNTKENQALLKIILGVAYLEMISIISWVGSIVRSYLNYQTSDRDGSHEFK